MQTLNSDSSCQSSGSEQEFKIKTLFSDRDTTCGRKCANQCSLSFQRVTVNYDPMTKVCLTTKAEL